jgi:hypothetical protein
MLDLKGLFLDDSEETPRRHHQREEVSRKATRTVRCSDEISLVYWLKGNFNN